MFFLFPAFRDMALKDKYLKRWSLLPRYNIPVLESLKRDFVAGCTLLQSSLFLYGKGRVLDFAVFVKGKILETGIEYFLIDNIDSL